MCRARAAVEHGHDDRGRDEDRQQVIRSVTGRAVGVPVPVVAWEQPLERVLEVGL